jgi:hypothetical protein
LRWKGERCKEKTTRIGEGFADKSPDVRGAILGAENETQYKMINTGYQTHQPSNIDFSRSNLRLKSIFGVLISTLARPRGKPGKEANA